MKKITIILISVLVVMLVGCGSNETKLDVETKPQTTVAATKNNVTTNQTKEEKSNMKLYINNTEIPVIWEENETINELKETAKSGDIVVSMSMYSDNEQVGSLGRSYVCNDSETTTHSRDIVLYNSSNIVVFYGSNTWAYTRLGQMQISEQEATNLLSNGNVTLRITYR